MKLSSNQLKIDQNFINIYLNILYKSSIPINLDTIRPYVNPLLLETENIASSVFNVFIKIIISPTIQYPQNNIYAVFFKFAFNNTEQDLQVENAYFMTKHLVIDLIKQQKEILESTPIEVNDYSVYPMNMCPPTYRVNNENQVAYFPPAFLSETVFSKQNCRDGTPLARLTCSSSSSLLSKLNWDDNTEWNCETEEELLHECLHASEKCRKGNMCVEVFKVYLSSIFSLYLQIIRFPEIIFNSLPML